MICLGCGASYEKDCEACYARLARCVNIFGYWPLATSLSVAALTHVERAIESYVQGMGSEYLGGTELTNCAANIRAYLQCVATGMPEFRNEPTDDWLA